MVRVVACRIMVQVFLSFKCSLIQNLELFISTKNQNLPVQLAKSMGMHMILIISILLFVAWGVLAPLTAFSGRFMFSMWKASQIIHGTAGFFSFALGLTGFLIMYINKGQLFYSTHELFGLVVTIGSIFQVIFGLFIRMRTHSTNVRIGSYLLMKWPHRLFGYILNLLAFVTIILGMKLYGSNLITYVYVYFGFIIVMFLVFETLRIVRESHVKRDFSFVSSLPEMKVSEF
jgi:hypothetical protein